MKQILAGVPNIILFSLAVLIAGGAYYFAPTIQSFFGGNLLSLSNIQLVDSPSSGLSSNTVWIANLVYNGGNNQLVGYTYATQPTSLLDYLTGKKSSGHVTVSSGMTEQTMKYSLIPDTAKQPQLYYLSNVGNVLTIGSNAVSYQCAFDLSNQNYITYSANVAIRKQFAQTSLAPVYYPTSCKNDYETQCKNNGGTLLISEKANNFFGINTGYSTGFSCAKYAKNQTQGGYVYYNAISQSSSFKVLTTLTNDKGEVETLTNTENNLAAKSADNKVLVAIQYGVSSFNSEAPKPADFEVVYSGSKHYVITKTDFNNIPEKPSDLESGTYFNEAQESLDSYNKKITDISAKDLLKQASNYPDYQKASFMVNSSTGYPVLTLDRSSRPAVFPVSTIKMSVDFVGVYTPLAKPQINSINPNPVSMKSGQQSKVSVSITNNGDQGMVRVSLSCSPNSINFGAEQDRTLNAGETDIFDFYGSAAEGSYTCTAKANNQDLSSPASKSFSVTASPICTLSPEGNFIVDYSTCSLKCTLQVCGTGAHVDTSSCTCVPDKQQCSSDTTTICDDGSIITTVKCNNGIPQSTGNVCKTTNNNGIICQFPYVLSSTTSPSLLGGLPFIGSYFQPSTTNTCTIDSGLLIMFIVGVAGIVLITYMENKKRGRKK